MPIYVLLPVSIDPVLRKMMKLDVSVTNIGAMFDMWAKIKFVWLYVV